MLRETQGMQMKNHSVPCALRKTARRWCSWDLTVAATDLTGRMAIYGEEAAVYCH